MYNVIKVPSVRAKNVLLYSSLYSKRLTGDAIKVSVVHDGSVDVLQVAIFDGRDGANDARVDDVAQLADGRLLSKMRKFYLAYFGHEI